ncbi:right-handed parallel beta-helix repeat-containing protein [Bacillus spongiae]|uniref:Right-handed parallel beta-helix repeat-containing protein n=1 Tax=Bacillus spongiae TaxID=2683610 RepID=A0ABU8HB98_9BACI
MGVSKRNNFLLVLIVFVTLLILVTLTLIGMMIINEKTIVVPDEVENINDAVGMADPGDIILVKDKGAPYEENVTISTKAIKLIGVGKDQPTLDGANVLGDGIIIENTTGVRVNNFKIQNYAIGVRLDSSDKNIIKENIINDNSLEGIFLNSSDKNRIDGNTVNDNMRHGYISSDSNSNIIVGNYIRGNILDEGIHVIRSFRSIIKKNTVNSNGSVGIEIDSSNFNKVIRNDVNNNTVNGIFINESNFSRVNRNFVNMNTENGILLDANSKINNIFFNQAFNNGDGNVSFDILDEDDNHFKGNKCGTSDPLGLCH